VALLVLVGIACSDDGQSRPDGSIDGSKLDVPTPLTLDISVSGCASYEQAGACGPDAGAVPCCTGRPPLALSFAPVGSQDLTRFLWTFGDDTPTSTDRAPTHTYAHPGKYQVTLVGRAEDSSSVTPPQPLFVVVERLAAGAACDIDDQCEDDLACLCAPGSGCASAFARGVCSKACETGSCGNGAVCAASAIAPSPDAGTGAREPLCLAACQTSAACASGFVCQTLPTAGATATTPWTRACLPLGAARDVGAPCRDANEVLDADACTTGVCADVGALGVCSAICDAGVVCPEGTACAVLADGRRLCLLGCAQDGDCARDPLLACMPATPVSGGPVVTVCAPKSCTGDAACAPSGRCGSNAVCVRR
jgi:PKD repeat protein